MRRLVFVRGTSSKFWEGNISGSTLTVQFGRLGTTGQTRTTKLASPAAATRALAKVTAENLAKGYAPAGKVAVKPTRKPSAHRSALVELAHRLGGPALATEVALAVDAPDTYAKKYPARLADRSLEIEDRQLAPYALIDGLHERKKLACLDWKQESDDSVAWVGRLAGAAGKRALASVAKDPDLRDRGTYEALQQAGGALVTAKLALLQFVTGTDSYELVVAPAADVKALVKLASSGGLKLEHLDGKELAGLEKQRLGKLAHRRKNLDSPNRWSQRLELDGGTTHDVLWRLRHWPFPIEEIREASTDAPGKVRSLIAMVLAAHDQRATELARVTKDPKLCLQALVYLGEKTPAKTAERLGAVAILAARLKITPGGSALSKLVITVCNVFANDKVADRAILSLPVANRARLARLADGFLKGAEPGSDRWDDAYRALRTVADAQSLVAIDASRPRAGARYATEFNEMIDQAVKRIRKRVRR